MATNPRSWSSPFSIMPPRNRLSIHQDISRVLNTYELKRRFPLGWISELPSSLRTSHIRNDSPSWLPLAGLNNFRHLHGFLYKQRCSAREHLRMCLPIESLALSKLILNVMAADVDYSVLNTYINLVTLGYEKRSAEFFTFLERARL